MELVRQEAYKELAIQIKGTELTIQRGQQMLVVQRYHLGALLNADFGHNEIPFLELETLNEIFGFKNGSSRVLDQAARSSHVGRSTNRTHMRWLTNTGIGPR